MGDSPQPLVTIGLPVYNAGPFLAGALRSILAQTLEDWELVVIDDGSTDDAWNLVERLSDPRIRVIRDGQHIGLSRRLNQILDSARGRYIARMDADDMCHPERLERQVRFLEAHPEVDAVSAALAVLDRKGRFVGWRCYPPDHAAICAHPLRGFGFVHPAAMVRLAWARHFRYDEDHRRCEDWELLSRASKSSRLANLPECLYFYREYDSFSLANYARSKLGQARAEFREASRYGVVNVLASSLALLSHVVVYAIATAIGVESALLRRRSTALPPEIKKQIEAAALRVTSTDLAAPELRRPVASVLHASMTSRKCE